MLTHEIEENNLELHQLPTMFELFHHLEHTFLQRFQGRNCCAHHLVWAMGLREAVCTRVPRTFVKRADVLVPRSKVSSLSRGTYQGGQVVRM